MKFYFNIALLILLLNSCSANPEIPSQEYIKSYGINYAIIDGFDLTGIYCNDDVDSIVFFYKTRISSDKIFWEKMNNALKINGWEQVEDQSDVKRYESISREFSNGVYAKELRVAYIASKNYVIIGFVEGGPQTGDKIKSFSDFPESKWAHKWVWPKYNDVFTKLNNQK